MLDLDELNRLGWRRSVMIVDDNLAGTRHAARSLLRELRTWQADHHFPVSFDTQASIDLALDEELLQLMADCRFGARSSASRRWTMRAWGAASRSRTHGCPRYRPWRPCSVPA